VDDEEMGVILATLPPKEAVRVLVDLANLRGGPDNITVIVARVNSIDILRNAPPPAAAGNGQASGWSRVHPIAWVALGVFLLLTPILGLLAENPLFAAAPAIGGLIAAIVILVQKFSGGPSGALVEGRQLGAGPHRSHVCQINSEVVDKLAKVMTQLREAAID